VTCAHSSKDSNCGRLVGSSRVLVSRCHTFQCQYRAINATNPSSVFGVESAPRGWAGSYHRSTWGICHAGRRRACGSGAFFDRTCYPGLIGVNFLKTWSGPDGTAVTAMQQIADWLKRLGISEYAQRFVENRIALSVLPDLTDQDLEKLGVLLGDRRKMLRAIRDLGNVSVAVAAPWRRWRPSRPGQTTPSAVSWLRRRWFMSSNNVVTISRVKMS
jgi:SAM domain (Sterile alpha motif)